MLEHKVLENEQDRGLVEKDTGSLQPERHPQACGNVSSMPAELGSPTD